MIKIMKVRVRILQKFKRKSDISLCDNWFIVLLKNNYYYFILVCAIAIILTIASVTMPLSVNAIDNEKNSTFANPWEYSVDGGEYRQVKLPANENGTVSSHITMKNIIPNETIKGATVLIRTSQQNLTVYVGNELIYTCHEDTDIEHLPSSSYHFVRMPTDCAGKEITVEISSPLERYSGYMNQIYIGSKASNVFFLFHENGFKFIIGGIVLSIGFVLMLVFIFTKGQGDAVGVISLGVFLQCGGFWIIAESRMAQFIIPYPMLVTNLSIFALSLLPVFLGVYYQNTHTKRFKKVERYIIIIMFLISVAIGISAIFKPMVPLIILPYYLILMGFYFAATFVSIIVDSVGAGRFFSTSVCGITALGVCCLIELVRYLMNLKNYTESNILIVGIFLFCGMLVLDLSQNFSKVYQASIKVNALTILAYTDSLTGLQNRTAFLERMSTIGISHSKHIMVAMFDINNLKVVNDTMGHLVGDALIRHCAKVLRSSVREDELYRIGGDEFVAIICHEQDLDYRDLESRLTAIVANENSESLSYVLSIAYGYASFVKGKDKNLYETLARADELMYECKRKQKKLAMSYLE